MKKQVNKRDAKGDGRYRRLVNEDFTGMLVMRTDGQIVTCNPAVANILGLDSVEAATSANFFSFLRSRQDGIELLETVRLHGLVDRHELEMTQRNGDAVYVVARLVGNFTKGELSELHAYLFNDTKRKRLEQQLVQSQKMEGLGTLAGGIAHDFNNILAIILGYANKLESARSKPHEAPGALKAIKDAVDRGAALVQQLLTSARQAEARFSSVDLNALVRELDRMLEATFPKTINFKLKLAADLPPITADKSQIHQVLLNLCVNARDAMPTDGTLTIATSLAAGTELTEMFTGVTAETYACICVSDTGIGMSRQVKSHIFEPFFTTKERGKGTGLGLSTTYGIVKQSGGYLWCDSEVGRGTTFRVFLPRVEEPVSQVAERKAPAPLHPGDETVLLVEDEPEVRSLVQRILKTQGYTVVTAANPDEAVAVAREFKGTIQLMVTDVVMPGMSGLQLAERLQPTRPAMRVLFVSGYTDDAMGPQGILEPGRAFLQKPFTPVALARKVREILDSDPRS
jgi:signal transduction histidine kinase/CheY-like chemotaxis protein